MPTSEQLKLFENYVNNTHYFLLQHYFQDSFLEEGFLVGV
jgi:hypothetical protein